MDKFIRHIRFDNFLPANKYMILEPNKLFLCTALNAFNPTRRTISNLHGTVPIESTLRIKWKKPSFLMAQHIASDLHHILYLSRLQ